MSRHEGEDDGSGPRGEIGLAILYALTCDRAYGCADGRFVAAGILPGALRMRAGKRAHVDVLFALCSRVGGSTTLEIRHTVGGREVLRERMPVSIEPGGVATITLQRIVVAEGAGDVGVEVRERRGEWREVTRLRVTRDESPLTATQLRTGPLAS